MWNYATTDPSDCYKPRYKSVADKERKKKSLLLWFVPCAYIHIRIIYIIAQKHVVKRRGVWFCSRGRGRKEKGRGRGEGAGEREDHPRCDIKESREARNRRYIMVSKERRILEEGEKRIIPAFKSLQVNSSGRSLRPFLLPSSPRLSSLFARVPRHEQRKTDYFRLHSLPLYSRERDRRGRERERGGPLPG